MIQRIGTGVLASLAIVSAQLSGDFTTLVSYEFDQCSCASGTFSPVEVFENTTIPFGDLTLSATVGTCPDGADGTDKYFPLRPGAKFLTDAGPETELTPPVFKIPLTEQLDLSENGLTVEFWIRPLDLIPGPGEDRKTIGLIEFNNQFDNLRVGYGILVEPPDENGDSIVEIEAYSDFIPTGVLAPEKLTAADRERLVHFAFTIIPLDGSAGNEELRCIDGLCQPAAPLLSPSNIFNIDILYGNRQQLNTAEGGDTLAFIPSTVEVVKFALYEGVLNQAQIEELAGLGFEQPIVESVQIAEVSVETVEDLNPTVTVADVSGDGLSGIEMDLSIGDELFFIDENNDRTIDLQLNVYTARNCLAANDFVIFGDIEIEAAGLQCPQFIPFNLCISEENDRPTIIGGQSGEVEVPQAVRDEDNVFTFPVGQDLDASDDLALGDELAAGTLSGGKITIEFLDGELFVADDNSCGQQINNQESIDLDQNGEATVCFKNDVTFRYIPEDSSGAAAQDSVEITLIASEGIDDESSGSAGAVVGGIIAALAVGLIVGYFVNKKMKENKQGEKANEENAPATIPHYTNNEAPKEINPPPEGKRASTRPPSRIELL